MIDWRDIPLYILNRNRLDCGFREMVEWFLLTGTRNVIVLDIQSVYPPLLKYYAEMKGRIDVQRQDINLGPRGFWWKRGYHRHLDTPYMVTDSDLRPAACPVDLVEKMLTVLEKSQGRKVGPSLRIDNLPDHHCKKDLIIRWEKQFWKPSLLIKDCPLPAYAAPIDTTLAMYNPRQDFSYDAIRLAPPYSFEHVPWYRDESIPDAEADCYRDNYETEYAGGNKWMTDEGTVELYGWSVRSKASLEATFKTRGIA